ncbi:MAG: hypothetical protein NVS9B6_04330 [Candidatus Limnocylindrales bacterium]
MSAPLRWDELASIGRPDAFTIANLPARLAQVGDLLAPALGLAQRLPKRSFDTGKVPGLKPSRATPKKK